MCAVFVGFVLVEKVEASRVGGWCSVSTAGRLKLAPRVLYLKQP